jgi:hypothetical protein
MALENLGIQEQLQNIPETVPNLVHTVQILKKVLLPHP